MFIDQWTDDKDYVTAHTSGSTGSPKPIRLLKDDMRLSARSTNEFFKIREGSKLVLPLSEDYIAGKMMIVRALESGADIIVEQPSRTPLQNSLPYTVDLVAIVPQQIDGIISSPCGIRNIIVGGAPVSPEVEQNAIKSRPETSWWATYGMTETCSHVALRQFGDEAFHAMPGITFDVDDRDCLIINNPYATWSPVITNDVVRLLSAHSFMWLGRSDNVIISGGLKIHPEKLERIISSIITDRNFYITGSASEKWGTECVLVLEGEYDDPLSYLLTEELKKVLSPVERPKKIVFKEQFRTTSSGKIIRDSVE